MAFVVKDNIDQDNNEPSKIGSVAETSQSAQDAAGGPKSIGPASGNGAPLGTLAAENSGGQKIAPVPGTTGATGSSPESNSQRSSGNFTNLRDYLNINSDQANNLASNISNTISSGAKNAQSQLGTDVEKFNEGAKAGSFSYDPNFINSVVTNPGDVVGGADSLPSANTQSTQPTTSSGLDQFKNYLNATYKGPTSLGATSTDLGDIQNKIQNAQNNAALTNTEGGRQVLLNQQFNKPTYTSGQQYLDQLFLENNPEAQNTFSNLRQNLVGTDQLMSNAQKQASNTAAANTLTANYAKQEALAALGGPTPNTTPMIPTPEGLVAPSALTGNNTIYNQFQNALTSSQNKLTNYNDIASQNYNNVLDSINNHGGALTDAQIAALGLQLGPAGTNAYANLPGYIGRTTGSVDYNPNNELLDLNGNPVGIPYHPNNSYYQDPGQQIDSPMNIGTNAVSLYGANIAPSISGIQYNLSNVLSPAEYKQMNDLNTLLNAGNLDQNLAGLVDTSQLNTADPSLVNIGFTADKAAIPKSVQQSEDTYINNMVNAVNAGIGNGAHGAQVNRTDTQLLQADPTLAANFLRSYLVPTASPATIQAAIDAYNKANTQYGSLYNDVLSGNAKNSPSVPVPGQPDVPVTPIGTGHGPQIRPPAPPPVEISPTNSPVAPTPVFEPGVPAYVPEGEHRISEDAPAHPLFPTATPVDSAGAPMLEPSVPASSVSEPGIAHISDNPPAVSFPTVNPVVAPVIPSAPVAAPAPVSISPTNSPVAPTPVFEPGLVRLKLPNRRIS